ncbi:MAG: Fic family protein [Actinobacteria bacterium]|nr:Fic family protein [Actinomycetota bacterium]
MDPERYKKSTGRLIKTGRGKAAYWAFIPEPLPPALFLNARMVRNLSRADHALGELAGLGRALPNPHLLIGPFMRKEAALSSRIEGTESSVTDIYAYEAGQLAFPETKPPEADVREVLNYVRAMEYGLERRKKLPISLRFLRELHERLMDGVRGGHATPGEFRRSQNWIGSPGCSLNEATYVPPPVDEMKTALAELEKYLHEENTFPPLVRLAFIHYQFEVIHPFLDGNGRIGRLLTSLLLVHWNLLPLPLLYLSAFFERNRSDYYSLLLGVSEKGGWEDWINFFLTGVEVQSMDAIERAKALNDLQADWRQRLAKARASALLPRLADSLFQAPVITVPHAQKVLDVTYRSAKLNIKKLEEADILKEVGSAARNKIFVAFEILEIVQDN